MPRKHFDQAKIDQLAHTGNGALRVRDLIDAGMASQTIAHRCRPNGPWQRILSGIVLSFSGAPSLLHRIQAALLYSGVGAVLTGLAALRLRGFRDLPADRSVHILIPHRRHRKPDSYVITERTRRLPSHGWVQGIPCAPVARAVIDATRRLTAFDTVRAIVAEGVQRDLCQLTELAAEVAAAPRRGSRLPRLAVREVMDGVRSVAEAKARIAIADAALPCPLWNHHVYDEQGEWLGQPDAFWPDLGVVVEIDSRAWHLSPSSWRRTQARQRRMAKYGLIVIPVSPTDLQNDPQRVLQEIATALSNAARRPPPRVTVASPTAL